MAGHMSDRAIIPRMYKKLLQLDNKKNYLIKNEPKNIILYAKCNRKILNYFLKNEQRFKQTFCRRRYSDRELVREKRLDIISH